MNISQFDFKAVIWDLDDTLSDSRQAHFMSWEKILNKYNRPHSLEFFDAHYGRSNREVLEDEQFASEDIQRISDEKEALFREMIEVEAPNTMPGARKWLEIFAQQKKLQGLASSGPMLNIVAQIYLLNLGHYFDVLTTGATLVQGKPHPQIFVNAAAGLRGTDPKDCLVIEDTMHGIEAALRAGMQCILVRTVSEKEAQDIIALENQYAYKPQQYLCIESLDLLVPSKH